MTSSGDRSAGKKPIKNLLEVLDLISLCSLLSSIKQLLSLLSALSLSTSLRARPLPISKLGMLGHAARAMPMAPPRFASLCGLLPRLGHAIYHRPERSLTASIYIKGRCRERYKWLLDQVRTWKQATSMADVYMEGQGRRKRRGRGGMIMQACSD